MSPNGTQVDLFRSYLDPYKKVERAAIAKIKLLALKMWGTAQKPTLGGSIHPSPHVRATRQNMLLYSAKSPVLALVRFAEVSDFRIILSAGRVMVPTGGA